MSGEYTPVITLAELPLGSMRAAILGARELVVCHTRDGVFAVDNICTHAYARLCEGRLRGTRLICPLHGASFDVRDGRVLGPPAAVALTSHAVRITAGMVEVASEPGTPTPPRAPA